MKEETRYYGDGEFLDGRTSRDQDPQLTFSFSGNGGGPKKVDWKPGVMKRDHYMAWPGHMELRAEARSRPVLPLAAPGERRCDMVPGSYPRGGDR